LDAGALNLTQRAEGYVTYLGRGSDFNLDVSPATDLPVKGVSEI